MKIKLLIKPKENNNNKHNVSAETPYPLQVGMSYSKINLDGEFKIAPVLTMEFDDTLLDKALNSNSNELCLIVDKEQMGYTASFFSTFSIIGENHFTDVEVESLATSIDLVSDTVENKKAALLRAMEDITAANSEELAEEIAEGVKTADTYEQMQEAYESIGIFKIDPSTVNKMDALSFALLKNKPINDTIN